MYLSPSKYHSKGSSGFSSTSIAEVSGNFGGSVEGKMIVAWFCICVRWYMMCKLWSHVDTSCQYFQCVLRVLGVLQRGFHLGKLFLVWLLSVGFKFWTFCWQSGFFILNLTTKEILKVFCSKDFKGIFLPKTFLPSAAAAALEIFCKKTSGSLQTSAPWPRAKAGWIHLNFSTSSRANCWDERGARSREGKCENRKAGRWISF